LGSSYARDDSKQHSKKQISSCTPICDPLVDIHANNYNSKDYYLCSDLYTCNYILLGFYQNCLGLRTKLSILKCNVAVFDYVVICFTETWLCDSFYDSELGLTNYIIYRCDRNSLKSNFSRGGGALIAIRSDIVSNLIYTPATNVEHLFVKLSLNNINYVVCLVYFPPNCLISAYESFIFAVQSVLLLHTECVFIFVVTSICQMLYGPTMILVYFTTRFLIPESNESLMCLRFSIFSN
jgi:hypothetical protein